VAAGHGGLTSGISVQIDRATLAGLLHPTSRGVEDRARPPARLAHRRRSVPRVDRCREGSGDHGTRRGGLAGTRARSQPRHRTLRHAEQERPSANGDLRPGYEADEIISHETRQAQVTAGENLLLVGADFRPPQHPASTPDGASRRCTTARHSQRIPHDDAIDPSRHAVTCGTCSRRWPRITGA